MKSPLKSYFYLTGYFMMVFGADSSEENAVATLESPLFEDIRKQCFHFFFSLNVDHFFIFNGF